MYPYALVTKKLMKRRQMIHNHTYDDCRLYLCESSMYWQLEIRHQMGAKDGKKGEKQLGHASNDTFILVFGFSYVFLYITYGAYENTIIVSRVTNVKEKEKAPEKAF